MTLHEEHLFILQFIPISHEAKGFLSPSENHATLWIQQPRNDKYRIK